MVKDGPFKTQLQPGTLSLESVSASLAVIHCGRFTISWIENISLNRRWTKREKDLDLLKVKRYFLDPSSHLRANLGQENISLNRLWTKREKTC